MPPLHIVCVQQGNYEGRGADYVNKLARGVARNLSVKHQFICLTDDPVGIYDGIEVVPLIVDGPAGWWCKLTMFAPGMFPAGARIIYFDLDTIITGSLDPAGGL